jgi:hypothetical protein
MPETAEVLGVDAHCPQSPSRVAGGPWIFSYLPQQPRQVPGGGSCAEPQSERTLCRVGRAPAELGAPLRQTDIQCPA